MTLLVHLNFPIRDPGRAPKLLCYEPQLMRMIEGIRAIGWFIREQIVGTNRKI